MFTQNRHQSGHPIAPVSYRVHRQEQYLFCRNFPDQMAAQKSPGPKVNNDIVVKICDRLDQDSILRPFVQDMLRRVRQRLKTSRITSS